MRIFSQFGRLIRVTDYRRQCGLTAIRGLAARSTPAEETELKPTAQEKPLQEPKSSEQPGWFSRFYRDSMIDTGHEQHSSRLSAKDTVYELQFHSVKPECMEQYIKEFQMFIDMTKKWQTGAELSGSFIVEVGDLDEAVHLWKYKDGYPGLDKHKAILRGTEEYTAFRRRRNALLRERRNQILLAFSFWPEITPRSGQHIYELRSYTLKPGTMIEWGNCWVKGLKHRREKDEAVAAYFSHIGDLYQVHHLWCYENLVDRTEVRENAWSRPGWDQCVSRTVALLRGMRSRVLVPLPFSPLQ